KGKFLMGSPEVEAVWRQEMQHAVEISQPFYLGTCTVTQEEYRQRLLSLWWGQGGTLFGSPGPSRIVPAECLWFVRHARQCLAMVCRFLGRGLLREQPND